MSPLDRATDMRAAAARIGRIRVAAAPRMRRVAIRRMEIGSAAVNDCVPSVSSPRAVRVARNTAAQIA